MNPNVDTKPDGQEREFVLDQEATVRMLTIGEETEGRHDFTDTVLSAGAMTPLHLHTRYDERFWVVTGSMTVFAGPDTVALGPGDYYAIPMRVPHAIHAGPDGARSLQISSPAGFAELVARTGTPAHLATAETEFDTERFATVSAELGDVILGPPGTTPVDFVAVEAGVEP
jgi:mannose-6-phosphate isomerase-like protein (cupin superfamily)